jgi:hypothetical protein
LALKGILGTFIMARAVCSANLQIFDYFKNATVYKMFNISSIPILVVEIATYSALIFHLIKEERIIAWENRARMLLKTNDLHTLITRNQLEGLLMGAPQEYKSVFSKYKPLNNRNVRKFNFIEKGALDKLLVVITAKVHRHRSKDLDAALNKCGLFVKDQRVIEYFLKGQLNEETLKPLVVFALHSKFEFLKHTCYEYLPLECRKALDGLWAGRI